MNHQEMETPSTHRSIIKKAPINITILVSNGKTPNTTKILLETSNKMQGNPLSFIHSTRLSGCDTDINNEEQYIKIPKFILNGNKTKEEYLKLMSEKNFDDTNDGFFKVTEKKSISVIKHAGYKNIYYFTKDNTRYFLCLFDDCLYVFVDIVLLKRHLFEYHGLRPFVCDEKDCKWSFKSLSKLESHKNTHTGHKSFICPVAECKKMFTTSSNLRHHHKHIHETKPKFFCHVETCLKPFHTQRALDVHSVVHEECNPSYKCDYIDCGKSYRTVNALFAHMRRHQHKLNDLICQWQGCNKIFEVPCRLREHMRTHTGEKPYVCTFEGCKWSFACASKLKRHTLSHSQDRKYKCTYDGCGKVFLRSQHLKEHFGKHSCQDKYPCPVSDCSSKFTARSSVYVHVKKVHKNNEDTDNKVIRKKNKRITEDKQVTQSLQHDDFTELDSVTMLTSEEDGSCYLLTDSPSFKDIILPQVPAVDPATSPLLKKSKHESRKGSARTSFTYNDLIDEKKKEKKRDLSCWENVKEVDSLVPTDGILGTDQNMLMDELYPQDLPVLLLESTSSRHLEFEASTINLRDLE